MKVVVGYTLKVVVGCNSREQEGSENAVMKAVEAVKMVKTVEEDYRMESSLLMKAVEAVGYMGKACKDQRLNLKLSLD